MEENDSRAIKHRTFPSPVRTHHLAPPPLSCSSQSGSSLSLAGRATSPDPEIWGDVQNFESTRVEVKQRKRGHLEFQPVQVVKAVGDAGQVAATGVLLIGWWGQVGAGQVDIRWPHHVVVG